MNQRTVFVVGVLALAGVALALRLPQLDLRPMHVDEAVHAYKLNTLWETGRYEYDLNEYHGPTLYYFTLPAVWLSGARDFAQWQAPTLRIVPVVFGVALILLLLLVADGLGRPATLCAAALTAISPALTYYSRYYIQEMLLVFFTFLVIAAGWRYVQTRRLGWALLAGAGIGLMHATKETCVIALGCMLVALAATQLWSRRRGSRPSPERKRRAKAPSLACASGSVGPGAGASGSDRRRFVIRDIGATALVAIAVSATFFSGLFTNFQGPADSIRAFATYFQRAGAGGVHEHPWTYYLHILTYWQAGPGPIWSEGLILTLFLAGLVTAIRGTGGADRRTVLLRFLALYTILMTLVYAAIPYKTPWCILSALQAMTLVAGVGAATLVRIVRFRAAKAAVAVVLVAAGVQLAWQAQRANSFKYCANERNPYVYAHTLHSVVELADQLDRLAAIQPQGHRLLIKVMVDNCWPLPWYLRRFDQVGYWEHVPDDPDADVILASSKLQPEIEPRLKCTYQVSQRGLRRDERLAVYIEQSLWDTFVQHLRSTDTTSRSTRHD
jgi:uncharacterized protein (TIGR03663 family)